VSWTAERLAPEAHDTTGGTLGAVARGAGEGVTR